MLETSEAEKAVWDALKSDRKKAEDCLLNYQRDIRNYEHNRRVIGGLSVRPVDENVGGGRSNIPGNPVEAAAILSADYDDNDTYRWLKAVEIVERGLGERKRMLIEARRTVERSSGRSYRGRPAWITATTMRYQSMIADRFIGGEKQFQERTVKEWWHEIVNRVVDIHLRLSQK